MHYKHPGKKPAAYILQIVSFTFIFLQFYTNVVAQSAHKDSMLKISFGASNSILYNLNSGTYTVSFQQKAIIKNAYALLKEKNAESDSRLFLYQKNIVKKINTAFGVAQQYSIIRKGNDGWLMQQNFIVFNNHSYFFTDVSLTGLNAESNYAAPLITDDINITSTGDNRALFVPFDNDMWVRYDAHTLSDANFTSSEATAVYNADSYNGFIIGSLQHEIWKTGIKINAKDAQTISLQAFGGFTDSNITHDKLPHGFVVDDKQTCTSPLMMIGYFDDWRKGMDEYGKNNRLAEPPSIVNWDKATPVGWNSWGVLQTKLSLDKAKGVVDFFHDECKGFRNADSTLYIDLDAFWDNMVKGGLDGDVSQLKDFVAYCNSKGFKPGIYWTPFADWGKTNRQMEGTDANYEDCWLKVNGKTIEVDGGRALDATNPAVQKRIDYTINHFKALGFKMIKIDFLGLATLEADSFYNKHVHTGMQAYAEGMNYLAKKIGNSMLVYAAISPNMATARYVHMRRIACDAFKRIDETAYTLNSTTYGWWLSKMYNFSDADHVVFDDASDGENRARLAAAIVTGSLITGDDYAADGKWKTTAQTLLQNKNLLQVVAHDGKSFTPVEVNTGKNAGRIFIKNTGNKLYIAIFNYSDSAEQVNNLNDLLKKSQYTITTTIKDLFNNRSIATSAITIPAKDASIFECDLIK